MNATVEAVASKESAIPPSLSVIVCAYTMNRWDDLLESVASICGQLRPGDELVLVIDHNEDLLDAARLRFSPESSPRVIVVANCESRGLSGARNSGIARSTGAVVAFVDDDAAIEPEWSTRLLSHYEDSSVAGVGGYALPEWPSERPGWIPPEFDWVVGCSHVGLPVDLAPVRNFIGCNMSFRRAVFAAVGGFRSDIGRVGKRPVGCEETELCIRLAQFDPSAKLLLDPSVRVRHKVSEDRIRFRYFLDRCFSEGISKHQISGYVGSQDALSAERTYATQVLPRAVIQGLSGGVYRRVTLSRSSSLARAAAIVIALTAAVVGYCYATVRSSVARVRRRPTRTA